MGDHALRPRSMPDASWMADAACAGQDPNLWHPHRGETIGEAAAKVVCAGCPVSRECLAYALARREPLGVWGGLSVSEREQLTGRRYRITSGHRLPGR